MRRVHGDEVPVTRSHDPIAHSRPPGRGRRTCGRALVLAAGLLAAGCPKPPPRLRGEFPPVTVADVQAYAQVGDRIRWGGELVQTTPRDGSTCFEVVAKPLDRQARPRPVDDTAGRFLACAAGFYDPAVWAPRREITVVGSVEEIVSGHVGEAPYEFPRVRAESVWLWPPRPVETSVGCDPWCGPLWYPFVWGPGVVFVPHHGGGHFHGR